MKMGSRFFAIILACTTLGSALAQSPQPVQPFLEGIQSNADGTYSAFFGYKNPNASAVTVVVGTQNQFSPGAQNQGQPTSFLPGRNVAAFNVVFNGSNLVWTLNGTSVTANSGSPAYLPLGSRLAALVKHAPNINGKLDGSLQQMLAENANLNSTGNIVNDWLILGVPQVTLNGQPTFGGIVAGTGAATPTSHYVTLNSGSKLRFLVRRTDAVTLPTVSAPQSPTGTRSVVLNNSSSSPGDFATLKDLTLNSNVGPIPVPAGRYGNFTANSNSGFVLGTAGSQTRAVYQFQNLTLNSQSTLQVVGPVEIIVGNLNLNSPYTVGSVGHPEYVVLKLSGSGGLNMNSNSTLYGQVIAPNGTININSGALLAGSVQCNYLTINSGGELRYSTSDINLPPTGHIDNITVNKNAAPQTISLDNAFTDSNTPSSELIYSIVSNSNPSLVTTALDVNTGILTLTFAANQTGVANLVVRATDPGGLTVDVPFTVTVNAPPTVALTAPTEGQTFTNGASITVSANASDSDGTISKVEFYADSGSGFVKIGEDTLAPYSINWLNVAAGSYTLKAVATDNQGSATTSALIHITINHPPTAAITSPTEGTIYLQGATILIQATAADPDGNSQLTKVEFFSDGTKIGEDTTAPYAFDWSGAAAGSHTLTVKATDTLGATGTSSPVHVIVNQAPSVVVTSPASGSVFQTGQTVTLQASATDADDGVAKVEFFVDGAKIGEDTSAPFSASWTATSGPHQITAIVTDTRGATATSVPITVSVNSPPSVQLTEPADGDIFQALGQIHLSALASDPDGAGDIARVDFYQTSLLGPILIGSKLSPPYAVDWNNVAAGSYTIFAVVTDAHGATGNSGTRSITVNSQPSITLTSPTAGAVVDGASVTFQVQASDSDGTVVKVEFFANGTKVGESTTSPFSFNWINVTPGSYQVYAKATDTQGGTAQTAEISIVINAPPTVAITAPIAGTHFGVPTTVTITVSAADGGGTIAKVEFFADSGSGPIKIGESTTAPYSFDWSAETAGSYTLTAKATDNSGGVTTSSPVVITLDDDEWEDLQEDDAFYSSTAKEFDVPANPQVLKIRFRNLNFDTTNPSAIKDAFELALVDDQNVSVVPTLSASKDAFFNFTEQLTPARAAGVSYATTPDEDTVLVKIDHLPPGKHLKLIARLLNNDQDTETAVEVFKQVEFATSFPATVPTVLPVDPGHGDPVAIATLQPRFSLSPIYGQTAYHEKTSVLSVDLALRNTATQEFRGPLVVVVDNISVPEVSVPNADGVTPEGKPYFDFSKTMTGGVLNPAQISQIRRIIFANVAQVPFTYQLTILGQSNQGPIWNTSPLTSTFVGQAYVYASQATDPEDDAITYTLLNGPAGMNMNSTGLVTWTAGAVGSYGVTLEARDAGGGRAEQSYVLVVSAAGPNRPPLITSTPEVEAILNAAYSYPVQAFDPDNDPLSFSLVSGPSGLTMSAGGTVSWTPTPAQVGAHQVVLKVSDGQGGETEQNYTILVGGTAGNNPPVFISFPVTQMTIANAGPATATYHYAAKALDADHDFLNYTITQGPEDAIINLWTGEVMWTPLVAGSYPFTLKVADGRGGLDIQTFTVEVQAVGAAQIHGVKFNDQNGNGTRDSLLLFEDNFTNGAAAAWGNEGGDWSASNGVYDAFVPTNFPLTYSSLPYEVTDFVLEVDVNRAQDGGIWLRSSGTTSSDRKGVLLVTGGRGGNGNALYWHIINPGAPIQILNESAPLLTPGVTNLHLRFEVRGNTYAVYVNGATTPATTLTTNLFSSGKVALYDFSGQTFDNVRLYQLNTEPGLSGWTIYLDQNQNGVLDSAEPTTTTGADGTYHFTGLVPGTYFVREQGQPGWVQTTTPIAHVLTLASGQIAQEVNFGNHQGEGELIRGTKWNDLNRNGIRDPGEPGLAGVKIYLDLNENGILDGSDLVQVTAADNPTTTSVDETGQYLFTELKGRTYQVREVVPGSDEPTFPADGTHVVTVPHAETYTTQIDFNQGQFSNTVVDAQRNTVRLVNDPNVTAGNWKVIKDGGEPGRLWREITWNKEPAAHTSPAAQIFVEARAADDQAQLSSQAFVTAGNGQPLNVVGRYLEIKATLVTASTAGTATLDFDAAQDFSVTSSVNGAWSYGYTTSLGGNFATDAFSNFNSGIASWISGASQPEGTPSFGFNTTANTITLSTVVWQPHQLLMHPGGGGQLSVLRWTAPTDGDYTIDATFIGQDFVGPTTTDVHVLVNSNPAWVDNVTGFQVNPKSFQGTLSLQANDTVDFAVGFGLNGHYFYDSTGVSAHISTTTSRDIPVLSDLHLITAAPDSDFGNYRNPNRSPGFTSAPEPYTTAGALWNYFSLATDADGDTLTYALISGPAGLAIDPATGQIIWKPRYDQVGFHDILIRVTDGRGGVDLQSFQLEVEAANAGPVITSTPPLQAVVGLPYVYPVTIQDPEADGFGFIRLTVPSVVTVTLDSEDPYNLQLGLLGFTPTIDDVGVHTATVRVVDSRGAETTQTYTLTIVETAPNDPPQITSTPRQKVRMGDSYFYKVEARDPNGDPLEYVLTQNPGAMLMEGRGFVSWTPTVADLGSHDVSVEVHDGRGDPAVQTFTIQVTNQAENTAPVFTSTPGLAATANRTYLYNATVLDDDGDPVAFRLVSPPAGMTLDPLRGTLRWTPTFEQVGSHTIKIQADDSHGGLTTQTFTLKVRGINLPPRITSVPVVQAGVNAPYAYTVKALDPENDTLSYRLTTAPPGMTVQAQSGLITWTPTQLGLFPVQVLAEDGQGGVAVQQFNLNVLSTLPNQPPRITVTPSIYAPVGGTYTSTLVAVDPEGTDVTYSVVSGPAGLAINSQSGQLHWAAPSSPGTYPVTLRAQDAAGITTPFSYTLRVEVNNAPRITSTPLATTLTGSNYTYGLQAVDDDGDYLYYSLVQGPPGMIVDIFGRVIWSTTPAPGTYSVTVRVTDSRGASTEQTYTVTVGTDAAAPAVTLIMTTTVAHIGDSVGFQVKATDNGTIASYGITVAGEPQPLNSNRIAHKTFLQAGLFDIVGSATDASGNTGTQTKQLRVIDPADADAPFVQVNIENLQATGGAINKLTDIIATVRAAPGDLESWRLEIGQADLVDGENNPVSADPDYKVLATGTTNVENAVMGQIDPTVLANGSYFVRVIATDFSGNSYAQGLTVTVEGDLKLGRFAYAVNDLNIPLAGIPITITRMYDTLEAGRSGDFGYGWSMALKEARVQESVPVSEEERQGLPDIFASSGNSFKIGTKVTLTNPEGKRVSFKFTAVPANLGIPGLPAGWGLFGATYQPKFVPEPGVYDKLEADDTILTLASDGTVSGYLIGVTYNPSQYTLTTRDGKKYVYDQFQGLKSVTDRNRNVLTYTHDGIFSTKPDGTPGASITFTRDAADRITEITDPNGKKIKYEYSTAGDLSKVTDQSNRFTRFTYLPNAQAPTAPAHYLDKLFDADGNELVKQTYDATGRLSTQTDALGHVTTLIYDTVNRTETKINPENNQTVTTYDERGNVSQVVNEIGSISSSIFDANNNPLEVTPPCGCTTHYTYDANGNELTKTDPMGNITRTAYNANNDMLSETDPRGKVTRFSYDATGNLTQLIDANGNVTRLLPDALGRPTQITDTLGRVTQFEHTDDPDTGIASPKPNRVIYTNGDTLQFNYDQWGRVTSMTDSSGQIQSLISDEGGLLTKRRDALGKETNYIYNNRGELESVTNALQETTGMQYDLAGQLRYRTDANGKVTEFQYDTLNRLKKTIDPLGRVTERFYRADGVVEKIKQPDGREINFEFDGNKRRTAVVDPNGNRTEFTYNSNNQVLTQTDALEKVTTYTYDAAGNLSGLTDRNGRTRAFVYDNMNRLTTEIWLTGATPVKQINMTYDALGNVLTAADDASTHTFVYDNRNRVQTETVTYPSTLNRSPFTLTYTYNDQTRAYTVTDAQGATITSKLDERSLLQRLTWQGGGVADARVDWTRNDLGDTTEMRRYSDLTGTNLSLKTTTSLGRKRTDIGYSPSAYNANGDSGALSSFSNTEAFGPLAVAPDSSSLLTPGGDPLRRITEITHTNGAATELLKETYTHDDAGQLSSETIAAVSTPSVEKTFHYDFTGQLTSVAAVSTPSQNEAFTYDPAGNRLTLNGVPYVIATSNRVETDGTWTYGYDDEGNLTGKATATERWAYTYDHRNRLTKVEKFDGANALILTTTNGYDVLDRRIQKSISITSSPNPLITSYDYYGNHIWSETKPDGATTKYLVGDGIDQWTARHSTSGGLNWYISDRLGSVKAITNSSGTPLVNYSYSAFGQRTITGDTTKADSFGFTGREHEDTTGLTYFRARWMDPALGRFLSEDPIESKKMMARQMAGTTMFDMLQKPATMESEPLPTAFSAGDYNLQRYVINNPLGSTDPTGLAPDPGGGRGSTSEYAIVLKITTGSRIAELSVFSRSLVLTYGVVYQTLVYVPAGVAGLNSQSPQVQRLVQQIIALTQKYSTDIILIIEHL